MQDQWPDLDWYVYFNLWERLPTQYKHVGVLVGVQEHFLARAVRNRIQSKTEEQLQTLRVHRRFYASLVLQDLVNEVPLPVVSERYKINRGMLQSLQNSSATFAGMVTVFCQKLGWACLQLLLDQFQSRLSFGVSRELCNLVRIPFLNGFKARLFYERGYQSVCAVAYASKDDVARLLRDSIPFESNRLQNKFECKPRKDSRFVWSSRKDNLTEYEAADIVIAEAKQILRADAASLGIPIEQFATSKISSSTKKRSTKSRLGSNSKKGRKRSSVERHKDSIAKRKSPDKENNSSPVKHETVVKEIVSATAIEKQEISRDNADNRLQEMVNVASEIVNKLDSELSLASRDNVSKKLLGTVVDVVLKETSEEVSSDLGKRRNSTLLLSDSDFPLEGLENSCLKLQEGPRHVADIVQVTAQISDPCSVSSHTEEFLKDDIGQFSAHTESPNEINLSGDLFVPGSLLQPRNHETCDNLEQKDTSSSCCSLNFSLQLSSSEQNISSDIIVVPPLKLQSRFDEVSSQLLNGGIKLNDEQLPQLNEINGGEGGVNRSTSDVASTTDSLIDVCPTDLLKTSICSSSQDEFLIIDVTSQKDLFLTFIQEWRQQQKFSFCFACESLPKVNTCVVGRNIKKKQTGPPLKKKDYVYVTDEYCVVGIAVCWGMKDVYYINLGSKTQENIDLDNSLLPPSVATDLPLLFRLNAMKAVFRKADKHRNVIGFDIKEQLKLLYEITGTYLAGSSIVDPKVAHWMLDPDGRKKNIHSLVKQYLDGYYLALIEGKLFFIVLRGSSQFTQQCIQWHPLMTCSVQR